MIRNPRALLAFAAACVALATAVVATTNPTTVVFPVVDVLAAFGGLSSLALAFSGRGAPWSTSRRFLVMVVAAIWVAVSVLAFPITFAYAACVPCTDDNTPRIVVTLATFAGSFLLFLAAALPARRVVA